LRPVFYSLSNYTVSGIYIHIPFCRQACHYCNFHFSVSQKRKKEFLQALTMEISLQKDFFVNQTPEQTFIDSIYLGGGTPSLLDVDELQMIFDALQRNFKINDNAEITIEANPDDLDKAKLTAIHKLGVNRLSIGIQSFHDADLRYMNRSHTAGQAQKVLEDALSAGFKNITADLIYGTPGMSDEQWEHNIIQLISMGIPHISAYSLTVEKKTALDVFIRQGKAAPVDEEQSARQFEMLCRITAENGFDHYEISNFGKPGFYSRHNLAYWSGRPYLGLGPSAHSFVPGTRQWNIANTGKYIDKLLASEIPFEREQLTIDQQYNEYVMTSLRTMWGIEKDQILDRFGEKYYQNMMKSSQKHLQNKLMEETPTHLIITPKGKFLADGIAADLFV
jgi:putative oxygen-independent coproporphyrinogen III oxidase